MNNNSFFSFRVLHQKAKASEANAITPRQRQQYSPQSDQNRYGNEHSPKYTSKLLF
jgi:hypothetical protein